MALSVRTTGVGSLPYSNIDEAIEYSLQHDLPFFPQLLCIHGNMIEQVVNNNFKFISLFIDRAKAREFTSIKVQIAGPNTTKASYENYIKVVNYLHDKTKELNPILFLDEPILEDFDTLAKVLNYIREQGIETGIHCCNTLNAKQIENINKLKLNYFSYDSILNPNLEKNFNDTTLVLGCVSTTDQVSKPIKIKESSLISANCGLALSKRDPKTILLELNDLRDNFQSITN